MPPAMAARIAAGTTSAGSEVAEAVRTRIAAGVAKMRAVDAVAVPAGKRVVLAPKGTHVMLMGLTGPLVAGETFELVLRFEHAGEQTVKVEVRPADTDAAGHSHH